jgi:hypothetical protein
MPIIKYRTNELTLTKSFSSPIFNTFSPAKFDACSASCAYIVNDFMAKLQLLYNNNLHLDSRSKDDQSEDKDFNIDNGILDPHRVDHTPAGEPLAIKDGSSNIDEEMSKSHYLEVNQEEAALLLSTLD